MRSNTCHSYEPSIKPASRTITGLSNSRMHLWRDGRQRLENTETYGPNSLLHSNEEALSQHMLEKRKLISECCPLTFTQGTQHIPTENSMQACVYGHTHTETHTHFYKYTHLHIHTSTHRHTHVHMHTHIHTQIYTYLTICMLTHNIYIHTKHTHTHTNTHIFIHTYTFFVCNLSGTMQLFCHKCFV